MEGESADARGPVRHRRQGETAVRQAAVAGAMRDRLRRGVGGQTFAQAVGFGVHLAGVPLFLHAWGTPLYGEWLILAALPAWLVLSDLGFTTAATHEITMRAARKDLDAALAAFRTAWVLVTGVSALGVAGLAAGAAFLPVATWLNLSRLDEASVLLILALLLVQVFVHMQANLVGAGLVSAGRYGLLAFLIALTRLSAFLLVALALLVFDRGPVAAAAVMAAVECAGWMTVVLVARRLSPWLRYGLGGVSRATFARLAVPSLGFVGLTAGNALALQGPILVIGAMLGPGAVAVFATLRQLARATVMLANIAFAALRPEVSMAWGRDDLDVVRRLNTVAVQLALWLAVAAFAGLTLIGPWLVDVWTGGRIAVRQPLFTLLLTTAMATLLWTGAATALLATNRSGAVAAACVLAAGAGLAAGAAMAPAFGTSGVAAAMAIAEVAVFAVVLARSLSLLGQTFAALVAAALRPPVNALDWLRRAS